MDMKRDIRNTTLYRQVEEMCRDIRRPGTGLISDAAELHASADGTRVVFAATTLDSLNGVPATRLCVSDLRSGDTRVVTFGPNVDRHPRFSPDGRFVAFLSDRRMVGDFQLYLLDLSTGAARATASVPGWIEYLHWSPDGTRILLGVAGHGADVSGGQGAVTSQQRDSELPAWMPRIDNGGEEFRWRNAWLYDIDSDETRLIGDSHLNIWEATWCGNTAIAAVTSPGPHEGLWYNASLCAVDLATGLSKEIYVPTEQLGLPVGSPSGDCVAVVEAVCSDRLIVAGELRLIDTVDGASRLRAVDTKGVDVSYVEWRSDHTLLLAGHRDYETVIGLVDAVTCAFKPVWSSKEVCTPGRFATVSGLTDDGDCALIGESFAKAPELAVVRGGQYECIKSFDVGFHRHAQAVGAVHRIAWPAPDGLDIHGWLIAPDASPPYPTILYIHGGPVWHWRPNWLGRVPTMLTLLEHGFALFLPNPRGSTGRGQAYVRRVRGDLGGAETGDHLSGLSYLVEQGLADGNRLGVTGGSHGGFMTSWLITQDTRFGAAVSLAPVTNYVTAQLISNIPQFTTMFLADTFRNAAGRYYERSPIMHAHKARTPTLNVCGALDRCTPPEEAIQFHSALLEAGCVSTLITYPEEGHGVRRFPAMIDYAARVVEWFERYLCTS